MNPLATIRELIAQHPPGRELDGLLAQRVLGCKVSESQTANPVATV